MKKYEPEALVMSCSLLKRFRMLFFISGANTSGSIMTNSPCII